MRWNRLRTAYLCCLILLAISLSFLLISDTTPEPTAAPKIAPTTTTSFLEAVPPRQPLTTTTTTTAPPTTTTTTTSPVSTYQAASVSEPTNVWDVIAECESDGNWGHRGRYEGGLQFDPYTWDAYVAIDKPYGLAGYPDAAYNATREQQITVAIRVRDGVKGSSDPYLNPQGWNAWPTCRHSAGV